VPPSSDTQICPYCGNAIKAVAVKCRFCGEFLDDDEIEPARGHGDNGAEQGVRWLIPIGRSGWAVASGYLGLLSCFPFLGLAFGILAVITGILALRHGKRNPKMGGKGRAIFGIIAGSLAGLINGVMIGTLIYGYLTGWK
jgi:hypothetical protein